MSDCAAMFLQILTCLRPSWPCFDRSDSLERERVLVVLYLADRVGVGVAGQQPQTLAYLP